MEGRVKTLTYKGRRHLPLPTGTYTVACTDIMTSYLRFGVFTRLYYPSKDQGILDRYLQWPLWVPHKEYINGYAVRAGVPARFYRTLFKIIVGKLYIPVVWQAQLLQSDQKYPVVVFSHGLSGWRTTYSSICMELASYGFVVVAVEHRDYSASASFYKKQSRMSAIGNHPGSNLCDLNDLLDGPKEFESKDVLDGKWDPGQGEQDVGPFCHANEWMLYQPTTKDNASAMRSRQLRYRSKEVNEVLDLLEDLNKGRFVANVLDSTFDSGMFEGRLDLKNAFFIGHSFGGATGILCLATELRFKAGVFLDPWMFPFYDDQSAFPLISEPFLCLLVKSFQTKKDFEILKQLQSMHNEGQLVVLKNAYHRDLCDSPFVSKASFPLLTKIGLRIEKFSALDLSTDLILQYLGQHLGKNFRDGSSKIERLKKKYLRPDEYISKIIA